MSRRYVGKKDAKDIAEERIDRLFELAEKEALAGNMSRSKRYVSLALRMGERHKVRASHKRTYCGNCLSFFVPPRNVRVRTGRGRVSMTCLECGSVLRYPLKRQKGG
jgi:ribonuclease P protein subunit RPR2